MQETQEWSQYKSGMKYKNSINLLDTVDKNERFYSKRHWEGVKTNGLPAAVLPYSKRITDFKIAMVASDVTSMTFTPQGVSDDSKEETDKIRREIASQLTDYARTMAENTKFDNMNADGLLNAAISGDMISFWFWDSTINAGNGVVGDLNGHLVNNTSYFPGDVNEPEINNVYGPVQPYIIIEFRKNVKEVREQAKKNGVQEIDLQNIVADNETRNQAGDRGKTELNGDDEDGKCIVLLKMWRKFDGQQWHIMAKESTESVVTRDEWDTGLHRYPVALMNWDIRKGSCHGEAEMTSLIPNNIIINQMASRIALWIYLHGFPRVIYDKTRIPSWTNDMSLAIPVNGTDTGGVGGAAQYMQPAQLSAAVQQFFETFIAMTKEAAGANESALGESAPTNTSAIIVNSKNAAVPYSSNKRRFYRYIEDVGLIWLDFWVSKYTEYQGRQIEITHDGIKQIVTLDTEMLKSMRLKLRIDVSPSSPFDEAAQQTNLDKLLELDKITLIEWLKRVRKGSLPDTQGLIDARESAQAAAEAQDKQFMYELMSNKLDEIMPTLSPEAQNQLKMLQRNDPQGYEAQVKQLIKQQPKPYANNVEGGGSNAVPAVQGSANGG